MSSEVVDVSHRPVSMARMILDRVAATPDWRRSDIPSVTAGSRLTGAASASGFAPSPPGCSFGLGPEDRVAIAAGTRLEWILADFGILCAGPPRPRSIPPRPPPRWPTSSDSGARVVFAEDDEQIAKLRATAPSYPSCSRS